MKQAWRIARAEFGRQTGRFDTKALVVLVVVGASLGALSLALEPTAPDPDAGIFRVQASDDALLAPAVAADARFSFTTGAWDLRLVDDRVHVRDTERGRAAYEVLVIAVQDWQDGILATEDDQTAAFPLEITVAYESREPPIAAPEPPPADRSPPPADAEPVIQQAAPSVPVQEDLRPDEVGPPFPIRSLLLTFAYVLPASLLAQVHASNLHGERTRHRGILLLSAPAGPGSVLLGKSAPTLAAALILALGITLVLGAGVLGFLAAVAFLGFLFATTSLLALISRSPRELSLLQVAATTLLNVFLFLPAMFPSIPAVAFLSPVHVVASGIRDDPVTMGQFLYAIAPLSLGAAGIGLACVGLLRDEILFSQRSTPRRFLGAIDAVCRTPARLVAAGALVVPFVFAAQILVLVLASVMGLQAAFLLWLPASVILEELAKGLPIWARHRPRPWLVGSLVGLGFFLAEKGYLVLTLVGFRGLPFGDEALALLGTGPGAFLLMVPLALHVLTAGILAWGMHKGFPRIGFAVAFLVHIGYDQLLLGGTL